MFPIGDDNSDRIRTPFVNYIFVGVNILVFLLLQQVGSNESFTYAFALVPQEITTGVDLTGVQVVRDSLGNTGKVTHVATPLPVYFNFLSSMFMHGDVMHIFGNMMFLFIFGDNLENLLGHIRYAAFYIVCGFAAAIAQIMMDTDSVIPMLGASGAISGVLGGYILLFPQRKVRAIIFVALGIWIVYQLIVGYMTDPSTGGVAYAAHIGGFFAGLALVKVFAIGRQV
jgi:membrane associated rhomboid family serine protease